MIRISKKIVLAAWLAGCALSVLAQGGNIDGINTYYIKSPRFARPLVECWIREYAKVRPEVKLCIQKGNDSRHSDMQVVIRRDGTERRSVMYFGEYAVLPVTTQGSDAARLLRGKTLSATRMRTIFFDKSADAYDNAEDMEIDAKSPMKKFVVYSGNDTSSVASLFADFYGEQMSSLRGKRISGDDAFLINAISADPLGVTFNALPNIYDLKARCLKQNLTLLRMDTNDETKDVMRDDATLDDVMATIERSHSGQIPTAGIGIAFDASNAVVREFLHWVITSGVSHNHQFGILTLDSRLAERQVAKVRSRDTAQK